jgi:hypothetical protein
MGIDFFQENDFSLLSLNLAERKESDVINSVGGFYW